MFWQCNVECVRNMRKLFNLHKLVCLSRFIICYCVFQQQIAFFPPSNISSILGKCNQTSCTLPMAMINLISSRLLFWFCCVPLPASTIPSWPAIVLSVPSSYIGSAVSHCRLSTSSSWSTIVPGASTCYLALLCPTVTQYIPSWPAVVPSASSIFATVQPVFAGGLDCHHVCPPGMILSFFSPFSFSTFLSSTSSMSVRSRTRTSTVECGSFWASAGY